MGRFAQADTIVPGVGDPGAFDRYTGMGNNPLRFVDPTGHRSCTPEQSASGDETCDQNRTEEELELMINSFYGWNIAEEMAKDALLTVLQAAKDISNYVRSLTGSDGNLWVRTFLGEANIYGGSRGVEVTDNWSIWTGRKIAGIVPGRIDVYLMRGFSAETLTHEMGHVLDNTFGGNDGLPSTWVGGGAADSMIKTLGGNPDSCVFRAKCIGMTEDEYIENVAGPEHWPSSSYGNFSVAEDFAESFTQAIYGGNVPAGRLIYINVLIQVSAGVMGKP